jgi:hypothetical protein
MSAPDLSAMSPEAQQQLMFQMMQHMLQKQAQTMSAPTTPTQAASSSVNSESSTIEPNDSLSSSSSGQNGVAVARSPRVGNTIGTAHPPLEFGSLAAPLSRRRVSQGPPDENQILPAKTKRQRGESKEDRFNRQILSGVSGKAKDKATKLCQFIKDNNCYVEHIDRALKAQGVFVGEKKVCCA